MFNLEQRALIDRLENFMGVRIVEVTDPDTIQSEKLRQSVISGHGRRSWFGKSGDTLYVYSPNLADDKTSTLLCEVISEAVAQKGLDAVGPAHRRELLMQVWKDVPNADRMALAYANGKPLSSLSDLGIDCSGSYLPLLRTKDRVKASEGYVSIATALLVEFGKGGFDVFADGYIHNSVVDSLRIYNRFHPAAISHAEKTGEISRIVGTIARDNRGVIDGDRRSLDVSLGMVSPEIRAATGYGPVEMIIPLASFMKNLKACGISVDDISEEDLVGRIIHPMAIMSSNIKVPVRGVDGKPQTDASGRVITRQEDRFCLVTDYMVKNPEKNRYEYLSVFLPSLSEVFLRGAERINPCAMSPRDEEFIIDNVYSNNLLWCNDKFLKVFKEGEREDINVKKNRRPRIGERPNASDRRERLIYSANVVKEFLSSKKIVKEFRDSDKDFLSESVSDVDVLSKITIDTHIYVEPGKEGDFMRHLDYKKRLEMVFPHQCFSESVLKSLGKNGINSASDVFRADLSKLRPKDCGELASYLDRIGVDSAQVFGRKNSGKEEPVQKVEEFVGSVGYEHLVREVTGYLTDDIEMPSKGDLCMFLAKFPFTSDSLEQFREDIERRTTECYEQLTEEDAAGIIEDTERLVDTDIIMGDRMLMSLREKGMDPNGVKHLSDNLYMAYFLRDDNQGEAYFMDGNCKALHRGYFPCDTEGRQTGYSFDLENDVLKGYVVDNGQVKDVCVRVDIFSRGKGIS